MNRLPTPKEKFVSRKKERLHNMNEKNETACCFTGHRIIPEDIRVSLVERLRNGVDYLYTHMNIKTFYAGGALGFDSLAAEAVVERRKERPDIRLVIVTPCI